MNACATVTAYTALRQAQAEARPYETAAAIISAAKERISAEQAAAILRALDAQTVRALRAEREQK